MGALIMYVLVIAIAITTTIYFCIQDSKTEESEEKQNLIQKSFNVTRGKQVDIDRIELP